MDDSAAFNSIGYIPWYCGQVFRSQISALRPVGKENVTIPRTSETVPSRLIGCEPVPHLLLNHTHDQGDVLLIGQSHVLGPEDRDVDQEGECRSGPGRGSWPAEANTRGTLTNAWIRRFSLLSLDF